MSEHIDLGIGFPPATAGDIATMNLASTRQRSWHQLWQAPERPGIAEYIVEQEHLAGQFLGDLTSLDRLEMLAKLLEGVDASSGRTKLVQAQVASFAHRFDEARNYLAQARLCGAPPVTINRLELGIDQACGTRLEEVFQARRSAAESRRLEDLVPLGALLAELGEFDEADRAYCTALREYHDVSPFALAWVCFQLGVLWGELAPERHSGRAAQWYRKAIEYLPCYVKARVHLAEIYLNCGQLIGAEALLIPVTDSGDPEVHWRLGDVMSAIGRSTEADTQIQAAQAGFEALLSRHLLAFADHGAEFYSGSGGDPDRAFELARVNLANRPTLRAFEQAYAMALDANEPRKAREILAAAKRQWENTIAFRRSPLSRPT